MSKGSAIARVFEKARTLRPAEPKPEPEPEPASDQANEQTKPAEHPRQ